MEQDNNNDNPSTLSHCRGEVALSSAEREREQVSQRRRHKAPLHWQASSSSVHEAASLSLFFEWKAKHFLLRRRRRRRAGRNGVRQTTCLASLCHSIHRFISIHPNSISISILISILIPILMPFCRNVTYKSFIRHSSKHQATCERREQCIIKLRLTFTCSARDSLFPFPFYGKSSFSFAWRHLPSGAAWPPTPSPGNLY